MHRVQSRESFWRTVQDSGSSPVCATLSDLPRALLSAVKNGSQVCGSSFTICSNSSDWRKGSRSLIDVLDGKERGFMVFGLTENEDLANQGPIEKALGQDVFLAVFSPFSVISSTRVRPAFITGRAKSISKTHFDSYDNIMVVLSGRKHVWLSPQSWITKSQGQFENTSPIRPNKNPELFQKFTLTTGDALFIPANYWHHVESEPMTVAQCFWYN